MKRMWFRWGLAMLALAVLLTAAQAAAPKAKKPAATAPKKGAKPQESAAVQQARKLGTPTKAPVRKTKTGLEYIDVKPGKGAPAKAGDTVSMQYTGWLVDGKKFDSSKDHGGRPFEFPLGARQVIPGWDEGVAGMKPGGVRKLIIPPQLGYGPRGMPPVIPPNAMLIFEVQYLGKK